MEAGSVKGKGGRRSATSDWMAMEQQRGISITSTVLQFNYRDCVVNLLDTPGHRDFSEDTYRVLAGCDGAVMVLDAAKGIEPQTLKLFEVCRDRGLPLLSFVNKWDRPAREPLEVLDDIESQLGLIPTPVTWPVGADTDFRGVIDRRDHSYTRYSRTTGGARIAPEEDLDPARAEELDGELWVRANEELGLLDEVGSEFDVETFLAGITTPTLFGSAMTNFGVRKLLDAVIDLVPSPRPRTTADGGARALDAPLSGFVFKVQANTDKAHRDRVAYVRICSGRFQRGDVATHARTGKPFATKYAHTAFGNDRETVEEAFPGDVVGWSTPPTCESATPSILKNRSSFRRSRRSPPSTSGWRARPTSAASSSFDAASTSSTRRVWCRCCATPTSAIRPRRWRRWARCSSTSPNGAWNRSSALRPCSSPRRTRWPVRPMPTRRCRCDRCLG
jgi:peptide chain release factor 3